jgi:hypothetical protein
MFEHSKMFMKINKIYGFLLLLMLSSFLCCAKNFASPTDPIENQLYINVKDMGAKGDGKSDDSEAFQQAFDKACRVDKWVNFHNRDKQAPKTVIIPAGEYRICKSLVLDPRHAGLVVKGIGGSKIGSTLLIWSGPKGENMIEAWGCHGFELHDLKLDGQNKCGTLIRLNSIDGPAYAKKCNWTNEKLPVSYFYKYGQKATAENIFERVYLYKADIGISMGDCSYICTSDMTFSDVTFRECGTGLITNSPQNLVYHFTRTNILFCDTGLYFKRGGYVTSTNLGGSGGGIAIRIGKQGINSGTFNFTGVRVEAEMFKGKRTQMLLAEGGEANIKITSMIVTCQGLFGKKSDRQQPMFVVKGGAHVVVENSLITGNVAELEGGWLQFDNCRFRVVSDPRKIKYDEKSGFELNNCVVVEDKFDENEKYITGKTVMIDRFIKRPPSMINIK